MVRFDAWKSFITEHYLDIEVSRGYNEKKKRRNFIRHGEHTGSSHRLVSKQLSANVPAPQLQHRPASRRLAKITAPHVADLLAELYDASDDDNKEGDPSGATVDASDNPPSSPLVTMQSSTGTTESRSAFVTPQQEVSLQTSTYPLLSHLGLDLDLANEKSTTTMKNFVGEIVSLFASKDKPLEFNYANSKPGQLINVPKSPRDVSFRKQAWQTQWIEKTLEQVGTTQSVAAKRVCQYLASHYEDEYFEVGEENDNLVVTGKMSAEMADAMWADSSTNTTNSRLIKRYLDDAFNGRFSIPESKVRELGNGFVQASYGDYEYRPAEAPSDQTPEHVLYWVKDIGEVLTSELNRLLKRGGIEARQVDRVFCVFGGDHGKGAFRAILKIVVRLKDGQKLVCECRVAHIDCKKDNGAILKNTIAKPIAKSLAQLKKFGISTVESEEAGETKLIFKIGDGQGSKMEVPVFSTGDLAYYGTILGKENSSPHWCFECDLASCDWKVCGHAPGTKWTLERIKEMAADENKTGAEKKGVKENPYFDIAVWYYCIPHLHLQIGLGNDATNHFLDWINREVEKISPEEQASRDSIVAFQTMITSKTADRQAFDTSEDGRKLKATQRKRRSSRLT